MELDAKPPAYDVPDELSQERSRLTHDLQVLVDRVSYRPDYYWYVGITLGVKYPYVQIAHNRPDSVTGVWGLGKGGKRYVTQWATESEVFQILLNLAMAYEEHEVREFFKVDGKRIYGPHIDHRALATVCDTLDVRSDVS